jgi:hypothetical protein
MDLRLSTIHSLRRMRSTDPMSTSTASTTPALDARPATEQEHVVRVVDPALVRKAVARRSYAVLATVSPAGRPHAAGVLYALVGDDLWVSTHLDSRKGRNVASTPHVGLTIPVRRIPLGPPSAVQAQARAEVVALDDPRVAPLVADGSLKGITSHGELDLPGGCFLRITPNPTVLTYGLGLSLWALARDPLAAEGRSTWR